MAEERTMKEMHHMPRTEEEKKNLLVRLRRAEGQIRGIEKMVENDVYCPDILIQVSAVQSALNSFNKELLTCHLKGCVAQDVRNGNDASLDELAELMKKLMKEKRGAYEAVHYRRHVLCLLPGACGKGCGCGCRS